MKPPTGTLTFITPFAIVALFTYLLNNPNTLLLANLLLREGGIVELIQFACFLMASIAGFELSLYIKKNNIRYPLILVLPGFTCFLRLLPCSWQWKKYHGGNG